MSDTSVSTPKTINRYESRIEFLVEQMKGIYEQLQIQTQVNAELKKVRGNKIKFALLKC